MPHTGARERALAARPRSFFERRENAEHHIAENPLVSGNPISLSEAIEAGRIVFGDLLRED